MKAVIITGTKGNIGSSLKTYMELKAYDVISWDRTKVPINNYHEMESFISKNKAAALIHLAAITSFDPHDRKHSWQVNYEWTSELAWLCRIYKLQFVFISTSMVFNHNIAGPYTVDTSANAKDNYGGEKREAEKRVLYQNPESVILRLGWQIDGIGKNNMISFAQKQMDEKGFVEASSQWFPSCSYLNDSTNVIEQSLNFSPGIYMVNSNNAYSFYEILCHLNHKFAFNWNIKEVKGEYQDQRMIDTRIKMPALL